MKTLHITNAEPAAFAAAIRAAATADELRAAKTAAARATAERFGWPPVCSDFLDLYQELHALVQGQGRSPALRPDFESTQGNWMGWEVSGGRAA